jgi:signal peptidase II
MKSSPERALLLGLGIAALLAFFDQLSKWWVMGFLVPQAQVITITPFFNIVSVWNRGISFGLFGGGSEANAWILSFIALGIIVGLVFWLRRVQKKVEIIAIGLVIGGAFGNVVDRLRFGAVADFLDFHLAGYHWPAFNLADAGITIGAGLLILDSLFCGPEKNKFKDLQKK